MYEKHENGILSNWRFLIGDIISLLLALFIAYSIKNRYGGLTNKDHYIYLGALIPILVVIIVFFYENYREILNRGYFIEFNKSFILTFHIFVITSLVLFLMKVSVSFSRMLLIIWFLSSVALVYATRILLKYLIKNSKRYGDTKKILLVTNYRDIDKNRKILEDRIDKNFSIIGVGILDSENTEISNEDDILIGEKNILKYVLDEPVDEVVILGVNHSQSILNFMKDINSMGVTAHYHFKELVSSFKHAQVQEIGGLSILTSYINYASDRDLFLKRLLDIVGAIVGLILTFIISIVIVPLIVFTSKGPILFKQKRVGRNGRIFNFYKFRSMYADAEERKKELMKHNEMKGHMFKMENDPRITPIGRFIRKTSIDELPQFWNVLKGDMSLVGTRPPTLDEYEKYEMHHKSRLAMKPGITGMWQVSGRSNIQDFEEVVALDREYIDNWTFGMDFRLLLKTISIAILGRGAK